MPKVALLGSTGSIGTQTLQVIDQLSDYQIVGISSYSNSKLLAEQINKYKPEFAVINDKQQAAHLTSITQTSVSYGQEALCEIASHPKVDIVVVAVVGSAGLLPTLAALKAGKRIALANKETLVAGGHLVMKYRDQILPIDSEHSALWQCLDGRNLEEVFELILTASGGPFRDYQGDLNNVTVKQALAHPSWNMGGKISIDSATLMNKGLEVIEARWLFDMPYDKINVVVHPQSIIHSMIRLIDGSILAQMGTTDMRLPIQYALSYPNIYQSQVKYLDLVDLSLSFSNPDYRRFPCLSLAYEAGKIGGTMPTVLNAANEIAVQSFLQGEIKFMDIPKIVEDIMSNHEPITSPELCEIFAVDNEARKKARSWITKHRGRMTQV